MDSLSMVTGLRNSADVLFLMLGAVMVFAMHAGFAFLEVGTVRKKNQVNAFVKILTDWSVSTVAYFLVGFPISYGISFLVPAGDLLGTTQGYDLVRYFFLLCFAACIPAIISGGIAERAKFWPQVLAGAIFAGVSYPLFESLIWGQNASLLQGFFKSVGGAEFHDFAGSVVVHSVGGWLALPAVLVLGPRMGRYVRGKSHPIPISNIPFLALGSWILAVGWFGFNVMSAGHVEKISGLVAVNSLLAMVGGVLAAIVAGRNDPGFVHNGALAGLIAICAGSDIMHPLAAFATGAVASVIFVYGFQYEQERLKIDDVLGVWPLHGVIGTWGGIAAGIFGQPLFGGMGGVSFVSQFLGSLAAVVFALVNGFLVYGILSRTVGIRLTDEQEFAGADLSIHQIGAYPEDHVR
ncbi:ammonium transporter [Geobacter sulfurreducens]|uniref:Ammonium transporter, putative n=1 Tax=Geobacter sulfurreducens (strain ATCC 51573 / DSM 12127 / PCA) TaxID=243231 RepID=Q74DU4_GEOSL|nr:ammonium transporter [Geobacter sulfurreducens]AAR34597.1 ammonium transporter, putative [Geobacter sulfurreducens PCA]ADI84056.1 ammonium transporter, putative [Geobacter sulfurreducens KN400]UAC05251.1 ammonium transporter [Geobacter sulfurreducens]UTG93889.1 ammonium transporter [Geobacter sulfurreducens]HBB69155.1 ammonium transporter [Geobacter sulfurreducens]